MLSTDKELADAMRGHNAADMGAKAKELRKLFRVITLDLTAAKIPLIYVNQVGGQDELIFDGASFVANSQGEIVFRAEEFKEQISVIEFDGDNPLLNSCAPLYNKITSEYKALVLGIKDYVGKNGFQGAILGLSGGIDSALVLALAVDALGHDKVEAVLMPSRFTQDMSNEDAIKQAEILLGQLKTLQRKIFRRVAVELY